MENILKNKLINNSEIARQIGMHPAFLKVKMDKKGYNKLTKPQLLRLYEVLVRFRNEIDKAISLYDGK